MITETVAEHGFDVHAVSCMNVHMAQWTLKDLHKPETTTEQTASALYKQRCTFWKKVFPTGLRLE